jgi:hypothetical protein
MALVLLNGALTGMFYTRRRKLLQINSTAWRIGFLVLSAILCVWLVIGLVRKLP